MPRLVLLAAIIAFAVWRGKRLDAYDRAHGFGPYADVVPVRNPEKSGRR